MLNTIQELLVSTEDLSFEGNPDEPYMEGKINTFWEMEAISHPDQMTDV